MAAQKPLEYLDPATHQTALKALPTVQSAAISGILKTCFSYLSSTFFIYTKIFLWTRTRKKYLSFSGLELHSASFPGFKHTVSCVEGKPRAAETVFMAIFLQYFAHLGHFIQNSQKVFNQSRPLMWYSSRIAAYEINIHVKVFYFIKLLFWDVTFHSFNMMAACLFSTGWNLTVNYKFYFDIVLMSQYGIPYLIRYCNFLIFLSHSKHYEITYTWTFLVLTTLCFTIPARKDFPSVNITKAL